jgi:hypothetical protein
MAQATINVEKPAFLERSQRRQWGNTRSSDFQAASMLGLDGRDEMCGDGRPFAKPKTPDGMLRSHRPAQANFFPFERMVGLSCRATPDAHNQPA